MLTDNSPLSGERHEEFREYVLTRGPALLRMAYQLTGNPADAEDLLQAALASTFRAWNRIQDRGALDGYVRRAMVNINISWWRRRKLEEYPAEELPDIPVTGTGTPHDLPLGDLPDLLEQALSRLPTRMRAAIMLRYYEDLTEQEIAKRLGISVGTVKSTVSRAMAKLRGDLRVPAQRGESPADTTEMPRAT
ncbi:RNA polymerase sigma-70 factor, sigma-E family [Sinosporangium album]|uniref:RNA polymerase sigma-70 factor, sigma-E family n=1 Tax=Sinosporangium album TaxID=504805 RepID=A0A1G8JU85_9ACTN|nr:SigE family RNA polymerase sigma factor [Sinosporangium album]SDI34701.1 RNA polymerase sigma-70 factor, sigma-E family [Sinosporangium album]